MFQRTVRTPAACGNFSLGLVGRPTHADSELTTGRLICDEIAGPNDMDTAIEQAIDRLTNAGAISAIGNRRAFRIAQEPLDLFRRYASAYARDQAYCCFSTALIANLERNWDAHNRKT